MPAASGDLKNNLKNALAGDMKASVELNQYLDTIQSVFGVTSATTGFGASSANLGNIQPSAVAGPFEFFGVTASSTYVTNLPNVSGTAYFSYIGRSPKYATTCTLVGVVGNTGAGTHTWAEVGVVAAAVNAASTTAVTAVLGFASVTAQATAANSGGTFSKVIPLTGCIPGQDLWVYYGSTATTTPFKPQACLGGDITQTLVQSAATQPSVASLPFNTTQGAATDAPANFKLFF